MTMADHIAIPSSGDAKEDRKQLMRFLYDDVLIKAGLCPNGCGPMEGAAAEGWDTILNCEHCGFQYGKIGGNSLCPSG
jgi:hypothetical protein